jgi:hypothetical protein
MLSCLPSGYHVHSRANKHTLTLSSMFSCHWAYSSAIEHTLLLSRAHSCCLAYSHAIIHVAKHSCVIKHNLQLSIIPHIIQSIMYIVQPHASKYTLMLSSTLMLSGIRSCHQAHYHACKLILTLSSILPCYQTCSQASKPMPSRILSCYRTYSSFLFFCSKHTEIK